MVKEIEVVVEEDNQDLKTSLAESESPNQDRDDYLEQLQRLQAEFENYRKRAQREREQLADQVRGDVCQQLLPILDDLQRALSHDEGDPEALRSGLKLVNKNFTSILENMGLRSIPALGQPFDPHVHEAILVEADPAAESESITEQLLPGYVFKDRLLRPAKVKVKTPSVGTASGGDVSDDITGSQKAAEEKRN